jgi:hypothetical protein
VVVLFPTAGSTCPRCPPLSACIHAEEAR